MTKHLKFRGRRWGNEEIHVYASGAIYYYSRSGFAERHDGPPMSLAEMQHHAREWRRSDSRVPFFPPEREDQPSEHTRGDAMITTDSLQQALDIDQALAARLFQALTGPLPEDFEPDYPATDRWLRQCYRRPMGRDIRMVMADELLDTHGVEHIDLPEGIARDDGSPEGYSYCNTGDAYCPTVVCDLAEGEFFVASTGDVMERIDNLRDPRTGDPSLEALLQAIDSWDYISETLRLVAGAWSQAWYWWLVHHHAGQGSDEYHCLCQLVEHYRPGAAETGPGDYQHLYDEIRGIS